VTAAVTDRVEVVASKFVTFLETGQPPPGLFSPEVFCDFTMPTWRLQATGVRDVVALRLAGHSVPRQVPRQRLDPTPTGFVLEVEETWEDRGELWYCRELFRADVTDHGITQLSAYCTGDWDSRRVGEHAEAVTPIRP
jgi:hypothetical protein